MVQTQTENIRQIDKLAVDTKTLQTILCCGRHSAVAIGEQAHAKVKIGGLLLWNVDKIRCYLDKISE